MPANAGKIISPKPRGWKAVVRKIKPLDENAISIEVEYTDGLGRKFEKEFPIVVDELPTSEVQARQFIIDRIKQEGLPLKKRESGREFLDKVLSGIGEIVI